ncbi:hypothetical protein Tco_0215930 [Tanacetum coccineum]
MEGLHLALKDAVDNGLLRGTKSHVYGLGVSSIAIDNMACDTGCTSGNIPFSYLGLSIGSNMNLLANWHPLIDRFRAKISSWKANLLSVVVIKAIHGDDAGLDLNGCNISGIWSSIISSYANLHNRDIIPSYALRCKVGDGKSIRFWKDIWVGNGPLCYRYNILFHLDSNKNCMLADRISNDAWAWNWNRQSIGSRNVAGLEALVSELGHVSLSNRPDAWSWNI